MNAKFYNSLTEGDFGNGLPLCQSLLEGDFWPRPGGCHIVYRGQDGRMDYDNVQAVMNVDAEAIAAAPNAPLALRARPLAGGRIQLRWRYSTINQPVRPTGFRIYMDSGSGFDFDNPTATVTASGVLSRSAGYEPSPWVSDALDHGQTYRFCVRSFNADAGETQNTDYVAVKADAVGPDAICDITACWEEI